MDQPHTGIVADRYELLAPLGRGGLGTVYRALDTTTGQVVALKMFRASGPDLLPGEAHLLHEADVLAKLKHRNILQVYEWGESKGLVYLALEYVDGESLATILSQKRWVTPNAAVAIARDVALALRYAHRQGVIHGDIKPGNVLIARDGRILLSDFGLSRIPGSPASEVGGKVLGTPRYMSPEQAKGERLDPRSDIFSLGAVLYELLSGVPAFSGQSTREIVQQVVEHELSPLNERFPHISRALSMVVYRALVKVPDKRFQSAREFVRQLDATGLATPCVDQLIALVDASAHSLGPAITSAQRRVGRSTTTDGNRDEPSTSQTDEDPTASVLPYVRDFEAVWDQLLTAAQHHDKSAFIRLTETIVRGVLREAIGYRIEQAIPYFQGTVGYMVDAPMLWIRYSRFPILFVAFDPAEPSALPVVIKQLQIAGATEFFAVLVVVPTTASSTGSEAHQLRQQVSDSVWRQDFVVLDGLHLADIIEQGNAQRMVEVILQQGVSLYSLSPYVVNGPVPQRMFFGREQEVKTVAQNIAERDYAIIGGRRIGKSSILLRLDHLFNNDPRFCAIYLNCEDKLDRHDFVEALSNEFPTGGDGPGVVGLRKLATAIARDKAPKRLIFLLDEVDELLAHDAGVQSRSSLFKTFRSLAHEGVCRFVFSGSRTLYFHLRDSRSPFFNFCEALSLRPLDEKSITEIVTKPMRQLGIEMPDGERFVQRLIELTSSHPNIAQWVCDRLVKRTLESLGGGVPALLGQLQEALRMNRRATLDDLEALAATKEFQEYYVSTAWGDASALERG